MPVLLRTTRCVARHYVTALTVALGAATITAGCSSVPTPYPDLDRTPSPSVDEQSLLEGATYRTLTEDWGAPPALDLVAAARLEGGVHWTGYNQDQINAWCKQFSAEFEIPCTGRAVNAGQVVTTLVAENQAGEAVTDVVYLSMSQMAQYMDKGLAADVDWDSLGVATGRVWADDSSSGNAVGVVQSQYAHFVNTDSLESMDLPQTVFDWLHPQWSGLICAPDFLLRAGNGFLGLLYDPDTMANLHRRLIDEQDVIVTPDCDPLIVSGERPLMYMGYGHPAELLDTGYIEPFWNPGLGVNLFSHAVAKDAARPHAARLFTAWTTSMEASELSWRAIGQGWPAFGHGPKELVSGRFADLRLVYESPSTFRERQARTSYFQEHVFGPAR
jgi:ABC-type Fe3+ transport system substrate-binding protein